MSDANRVGSTADLDALAKDGQASLYPDGPKVLVGRASCGKAAGADDVFEALDRALDGAEVTVESTGCLGFCAREPLVEVLHPDGRGVVYEDVSADGAEALADAVAAGREPTGPSVLGVRPHNGAAVAGAGFYDLDFYAAQRPVVLDNAGLVAPDSVEEYVGRGGYWQLWDVLHGWTPDEVIREVQDANLRGRGGAGFPTGVKWEITRDAPRSTKYVICNADEGDPGAYMDRAVLESDPFAVLEGMTIGGYAIGADTGIVFIRAEYPLAVRRLEDAIEAAREHGLLGEDVMGTEFSFDIAISRGAGAFVAGEETALIKTLEAERAEPEPRPPYPARSGLHGQPTTINNVETWANVPRLLEHGAAWFDAIGTEESSGTKVFSLTGNIENTGLVEVPMGTTLEEVVYGVGGAPAGSVKAVQTGGPSGGCIPENRFDTPIDYESLESVGSIMGSGGLIVLDNETCMVEVARYFLSFTQEESCGKCPPCRLGTRRMLDLLEDVTAGRSEPEALDRLEALAEYVAESSLCGLGQTAPTPVTSTLRYFRDEYEAHLEGRCPAGTCFAETDHAVGLAPEGGGP